jgi:hypothetical protein
VEIVIRGTGGPGRRCTTDTEHVNVHVGLQRGKDPDELRPGDVDATEWRITAEVSERDGVPDFRGPHVQGRPGARFVYLTWGEVGNDGTFAMFRRAKLPLSRVDSPLIEQAGKAGAVLVAAVALTGADGGPVCATPGADRLAWSVERVPAT